MLTKETGGELSQLHAEFVLLLSVLEDVEDAAAEEDIEGHTEDKKVLRRHKHGHIVRKLCTSTRTVSRITSIGSWLPLP